jgi:hypothetical protein
MADGVIRRIRELFRNETGVDVITPYLHGTAAIGAGAILTEKAVRNSAVAVDREVRALYNGENGRELRKIGFMTVCAYAALC